MRAALSVFLTALLAGCYAPKLECTEYKVVNTPYYSLRHGNHRVVEAVCTRYNVNGKPVVYEQGGDK